MILFTTTDIHSLNFALADLKRLDKFSTIEPKPPPLSASIQKFYAGKTETLKPVYIFRRWIASCTVITTLTALSASTHISDSYVQGRSHRKHTCTHKTMFRHEKQRIYDTVGFFSWGYFITSSQDCICVSMCRISSIWPRRIVLEDDERCTVDRW